MSLADNEFATLNVLRLEPLVAEEQRTILLRFRSFRKGINATNCPLQLLYNIPHSIAALLTLTQHPLHRPLT